MRQSILEAFEITGRGTVVVVPEATDLPVGKVLRATVTSPDGSQLQADAYKEWLLRKTPAPLEHEAYLLRGVPISSISPGAEVECFIQS